MRLLHNIGDKPGRNYTRLQTIIDCNDPLSFDGVYLNVYDNVRILESKNVTLFVMGDYVGKDNSFDVGQQLEMLCGWDQLFEMRDKLGFKLGWHTWSHRDLTRIETYEEILREVTPPFPMDWFAYPHGRFNQTVLEAVKEAGFKDAWSVHQGNGEQFQRNREYL